VLHLIDKDEARLIPLITDTELARSTFEDESTETLLPNLEQDRTDKDEPNVTKSTIESPFVELKNDLRDTLDPSSTKSSTDKVFAKNVCVFISDEVDPH
jgi:hypothetical protein